MIDNGYTFAQTTLHNRNILNCFVKYDTKFVRFNFTSVGRVFDSIRKRLEIWHDIKIDHSDFRLILRRK
jgi:hypothetical protein